MKYLAESIGTFLLVAVVVGSGIMAENLSQGNDAVALLGNTISTTDIFGCDGINSHALCLQPFWFV